MNQKLRVAYVSAELYPFAKSGESADVACALPKYLSSQGMEVSVFIPKYRNAEVESFPMECVMPELQVPLGDQKMKASVYKGELGKYEVFFIDNPRYYWRDSVYGTGSGDYLDNDERFAFFSRAVLEFLCRRRMAVDIIHCNNWPTALIPVLLKTRYIHKRLFKETATVFTLHNVAYQGSFPPESLALTQLSWDYFTPERLSFNGKFNFLKSGLVFADILNTVSSSYRREIQTRKHGCGLEEIIRRRRDALFSIRNGVDYETWNPETDPYIAANYSARDLTGKRKCKLDLIREFGLSVSARTPLLGIVSYMSAQKGFDLLLDALEELMKMRLALVILGRGEEKYHYFLSEAQKKYPRKMAVKFEASPALTHKVAAGADIFLIPSLYEPCGLNQLYSFRYGTVPLVRATGGLGETVKPFDPETSKGNGFVFKEYSARGLLQAIKDALDCYNQPETWERLMRAGLKENFSWVTAARKYIKLYQKALQIKRGG